MTKSTKRKASFSGCRRTQFRDFCIAGIFRRGFSSRCCGAQRIPYVLSGGQSFFDRAEIKDLCMCLRLIANPDDDPAFIRAITTPRRGVGNTTLEALGAFAGAAKVSLFEAVFMGGRLSARQVEPLRTFCEWIRRLSDRAARDPATEVLDDMMEAHPLRSISLRCVRRASGAGEMAERAGVSRRGALIDGARVKKARISARVSGGRGRRDHAAPRRLGRRRADQRWTHRRRAAADVCGDHVGRHSAVCILTGARSASARVKRWCASRRGSSPKCCSTIPRRPCRKKRL